MFDYIQNFSSEYYLLSIVVLTIFSLLIGSFLNVVIYRLPITIFNEWRNDCYDFLEINPSKENINKHNKKYNVDSNITFFSPKRSQCPKCNNPIKFYDNIPILSFLLLRGKCRECNQSIAWRYPLIEFLTALASILVIFQFGFTPLGFSIIFLSYLLIIIAAIDFEHMIIPDSLSYVGLWLGLLINLKILNTTNITSIDNSIIGAVVGYLLLWSLYWLFKILTGKEGFGHGDFKLTALFGAWLGVFHIFPLLIIASVTGIIFTVTSSLLGKHNLEQPFPFGPYLVFAGWIVLLYKDCWPVNILTIII